MPPRVILILALLCASTVGLADTIDNPFPHKKADSSQSLMGTTLAVSSANKNGYMKGLLNAQGSSSGDFAQSIVYQQLGGSFYAEADQTYSIRAKGDYAVEKITGGGWSFFIISIKAYDPEEKEGKKAKIADITGGTSTYTDSYDDYFSWTPDNTGYHDIYVETYADVSSSSNFILVETDYKDQNLSGNNMYHFLDFIQVNAAPVIDCDLHWGGNVSWVLPMSPGAYTDPHTEQEFTFDLSSVGGFAGQVAINVEVDCSWLNIWLSDDMVELEPDQSTTIWMWVNAANSPMHSFWSAPVTINVEPFVSGGRGVVGSTSYPFFVQGGPLPETYRTAQDVVGVFESDAQWGDLDGDGDHDLVLCGESDGGLVTLVYRNDVDSLLALPNALPGISGNGSGPLALGDVDLDGDLDLALAGMGDTGRIAELWLGDGTGLFTVDGAQSLLPVNNASLAWADVDLDGDLDLYLHGYDGAAAAAKLYRNDAGVLVDSGQTLTGHYGGSADFGDYDGDGDMDLVVTGNRGGGVRGVVYYVNDPPGTLTADGDHGLPDLGLSDVAAGDYDLDGDLDLVVTGEDGTNRMTRVYGNDGSGTFVQAASVLDVYRSACAWGDADADGDLDLAVLGYTGTQLHTKLFENDAGGFVEVQSWPGVREGSLSFVDADGDGDLDLFVTGADWSTNYAQLEERTWSARDHRPTAPAVLTSDYVSGRLELGWSAGTDLETPPSGLYYAVRVGTSEGDDDVFAGTYASPLLGNVGQALSLSLDVPNQTYHWSVRTVDAGLQCSDWADGQIVVGVSGEAPIPPVASLVLEANVPNPFNPGTVIGFTLPAGPPRAVRLNIYDAAGRFVRTLADGTYSEGWHTVTWDGIDARGRPAPSGVYSYQAEGAGETTARRMVLLR